MGTSGSGVVRFDDVELDLDLFELRRTGEPVALEPRALEVLSYLAVNRGRIVSKEELLDNVWGDNFVGESALATQIRAARSAVGDDGKAQRVIRTVHGRGYRFIAVVDGDGTGEETGTDHEPRADGDAADGWPANSDLFGREAELAALTRTIAASRLVTVIGPAGVGKTSLVRSLMASRTPAIAEDWVWADLTQTGRLGSVANVVLDGLKLGQHPDAASDESLVRHLDRRETTIVLDNCEHVAEQAGALARLVTERCPNVRILATSQVSLRLSGETIMRLRPLDTADAAELFLTRARQGGAPVDPGPELALEICERLDGLPLAVELAASRARVVAPQQLIELLDSPLEVLRRRPTDNQRHDSLDAALSWAFEELGDHNRSAIGRLAVFTGEVSLDEVMRFALPHSTVGEALDLLDELVERSLLAPSSGSDDDEIKFRMLEVVRNRALSGLEDPLRVRLQHAEHMAEVVEDLNDRLQTPEADLAARDMKAAWPNVRLAAHQAAEAGETTTVRRIVRAVVGYAETFSRYELLEWCEAAALTDAGDDDPAELVADALAAYGRMLAHRGQHAEARELIERAVAIAETPVTVLAALWAAYYSFDLGEVTTRSVQLQALTRAQAGIDKAFADSFTALAHAIAGDADPAGPTVDPTIAHAGLLGAAAALVHGLRLATVAPERALPLLDAAIEAALESDYGLILSAAGNMRTHVRLQAAEVDEAVESIVDGLEKFSARGLWASICSELLAAARILFDAGDVTTAAKLVACRQRWGFRYGLSELMHEALMDDLEAEAPSELPQLLAQGAELTPPEAAELAVDALSSTET